MRANECKQSEIIGQCRADIGVERSRHQAALKEINELKSQLEEKQADIALTQTAIQVRLFFKVLKFCTGVFAIIRLNHVGIFLNFGLGNKESHLVKPSSVNFSCRPFSYFILILFKIREMSTYPPYAIESNSSNSSWRTKTTSWMKLSVAVIYRLVVHFTHIVTIRLFRVRKEAKSKWRNSNARILS